MAVVTCPTCGTKNRVDERRAQQEQPKCGKCGTPLPAGAGAAAAGSGAGGNGHPVEVTDATFQQAVLGAGATPVLLDCWAPWCGPCRMLAPTLEQLAQESGGRYQIAKLNTDENPRTASQFKIDAIPTMLIFKNGQLVDRITGLAPKQAIVQKLAQYA
jgi:thioredoxin 2